MKSILILVGKTTNKHFAAGIKDYTERIGHYMPFEIVTIPELRATASLSEAQQKEKEGELILQKVQPADTLVLLDEHGREPRSVELAAWLEKKRTTARRLVFAIGGPSLSRLTFSHQMVRLVFVEQLYRACTIIKGEKYHHE